MERRCSRAGQQGIPSLGGRVDGSQHGPIVANIQKAIDANYSRLDRINSIREAVAAIGGPNTDPVTAKPALVAKAGKPERFEAGMMYPLIEADRYDDDLGEGYRFAAIPPDAEPGKCHTFDCWIVNEKGELHPGYDACPVPIQMSDLDMAAGVPNPKEPPQPKTIFDSPWVKQ